MDQTRLVQIVWEELKRAVDIATDQFTSVLRPGLALQPLWQTISELSYALLDVFETFYKQVQRAVPRIVSRVLVESLVTPNHHRVIRIDKAVQFAADTVQAAIYELSGNVPPPGLHVAERFLKFKGLHKRFVSIEERQILGGLLFKALKFIRYPALQLIRLGHLLWDLVLLFMALGGCVALYYVVTADWTPVALPQRNHRHRSCLKSNMRISLRRRRKKCLNGSRK